MIQVTFTGSGAEQQVQVRGPVAPPVQGAMMNEVADVSPVVSGAINTPLGASADLQVFAGPRDDPFFLDLEAAFCILPDRKPVGGPLAAPCALTPNPSAPFYFRNPGINYVQGFNVLSIVVELPSSTDRERRAGQAGHLGNDQPLTRHSPEETPHAPHQPLAPRAAGRSPSRSPRPLSPPRPAATMTATAAPVPPSRAPTTRSSGSATRW